jgi:uncharacterized protein YcbK (DUF882 family)
LTPRSAGGSPSASLAYRGPVGVLPAAALALGSALLLCLGAPNSEAASPRSPPSDASAQGARSAGGGHGRRAAKPQRRRARWRPVVRAGYREAMARWHAVGKGERAPLDPSGRPMLVLVSLNLGDRAALRASSDAGGFGAADLERASRALRDPRTGLAHPVEPMVLDVVYRAQRRFSAPEIRVVSGYRAPGERGHSNHGRGRAIDLIVPGARDDEVATWAKGLGFTGVGVYPNAGYVHVDVRPHSHYWVDASGPGQRNREVGVKGTQAQRSDDAARRRGERPIAPFVLPSGNIEAAFRGGAPPPEAEAAAVEDDAAD